MSNLIRPIAAVHTSGTSYHRIKTSATAEQLIALFGQPTYDVNSGHDPVNIKWNLQIDGKPFTIYDWNQYRPIKLDETIDWHIGAHDLSTAVQAAEALRDLLGPIKEPSTPYIDLNYQDRTAEVEARFHPTLEDMKRDPELYAEVVNDLLYHWIYGTRETTMMNLFKQDILKPKS